MPPKGLFLSRHFVDEPLDHALQQRILAGEIVEQATFAEPGSLGHGLKRQSTGADGADEFRRSVENLLPGAFAPADTIEHSHLLSTLALNRPDGI